MCRCYFGLAQKRKTVIEITKNRDEGHLPIRWRRVNMSLRRVKMCPNWARRPRNRMRTVACEGREGSHGYHRDP